MSEKGNAKSFNTVRFSSCVAPVFAWEIRLNEVTRPPQSGLGKEKNAHFEILAYILIEFYHITVICHSTSETLTASWGDTGGSVNSNLYILEVVDRGSETQFMFFS